MHKRVDVVRHIGNLGDWSLNVLALVVLELVIQNPDDVITVRPLLFVPQSKGMSNFVHWRSELKAMQIITLNVF